MSSDKNIWEVNNDFDMYFRGCYLKVGEEVGRVEGCNPATNDVLFRLKNGSRMTAKGDEISFVDPTLGYQQVKDTVVFLSRRPSRTTRKAIHENVISLVFPQQEEYASIGKMLPTFNFFNVFNKNYTRISDLDKSLESKDAVVVARFFAVVKKASHENPVLMYRDLFVGEYLGKGEFKAFDGMQSIVDKLHLEVSDDNVRY